MILRVHIERLVLDGFDFSAPDAAHFELALQAELVHRLSVPVCRRSGAREAVSKHCALCRFRSRRNPRPRSLAEQ